MVASLSCGGHSAAHRGIMSETKNISGYRRALRHRAYATFVAGNCFSLSADWSNRIAIGWLTWQYTESPAWLGVMSFSDLAPTVLFSLVAGAPQPASRLHVGLDGQCHLRIDVGGALFHRSP